MRTREVGVSSRNVVSRTFPHFSQSMFDTYAMNLCARRLHTSGCWTRRGCVTRRATPTILRGRIVNFAARLSNCANSWTATRRDTATTRNSNLSHTRGLWSWAPSAPEERLVQNQGDLYFALGPVRDDALSADIHDMTNPCPPVYVQW